MNFHLRAFARLAVASALLTASAFAQLPDKFTNLQYFPKDITKQQLLVNMREFSAALGAHCDTCHVEKGEHKMDWASDDKKEKRTARVMLKMVDEINHSYLAKLGPDAVQVRCMTCHRGIEKPQAIDSLLSDTINKKGVQAAVDQYTDLRKKYYGSAAYDFSERPLDMLAESLLAQNKPKDAVAIMDMNVGFNTTPSPFTYTTFAMAHKANGQNDKAIADLEKVLAVHPNDRRAKQMLDELKAGK